MEGAVEKLHPIVRDGFFAIRTDWRAAVVSEVLAVEEKPVNALAAGGDGGVELPAKVVFRGHAIAEVPDGQKNRWTDNSRIQPENDAFVFPLSNEEMRLFQNPCPKVKYMYSAVLMYSADECDRRRVLTSRTLRRYQYKNREHIFQYDYSRKRAEKKSKV